MSDLNPEEMKDALRADMRQRWKAELQNREKKVPKSRLRSLGWWGFATAAVIALLISLLIWLARDPLNSEELFANYFEAPINTYETTQRGATNESDIQAAMQAYEAGNYSLTLDLFQNQADSLQSDGAFFYQGIAALALNKVPNARQYLNQAAQGPYSQSVEWFLALCDLKEANYADCRRQLEQITTQESHPYASGAADLLARLNQK